MAVTSETGPETLEGTLDTMEAAGEKDVVSLDDVRVSIGQKAFGPMLLFPGLVMLSPVGGVPGVPTAMALMVLLVSVQMLAGMEEFWLPRFLRQRSVQRSRLTKAVRYLRKPARFIDKIFRQRLNRLTQKPFTYLIAATCALLSLMTPPLELVPFAGAAPASAITAFGLAIMANDGLAAIVAFAAAGASFYLVGTTVL